jgi:hypothetical protein
VKERVARPVFDNFNQGMGRALLFEAPLPHALCSSLGCLGIVDKVLVSGRCVNVKNERSYVIRGRETLIDKKLFRVERIFCEQSKHLVVCVNDTSASRA